MNLEIQIYLFYIHAWPNSERYKQKQQLEYRKQSAKKKKTVKDGVKDGDC